MDEKYMGTIFYKNTAAIICLLITILCCCGSSFAAVQEADLFEKAYEYYLALNPEKAIEAFDLFVKQFPDSSALDSVLFWRAKSLMQMKRVEEASKGFRKLRELFPESSYSIFAEKELETLKSLVSKSDRSDAVREKAAKTSDAKIDGYEDRIRKLETEKLDLEKQLSDAEKKRQLTEKGLSKALDDKNILESQLEELKRIRADFVQRGAALEKGSAESAKLIEEKKALESRLKTSEEKIRSLSLDLAKNEEKIAAISKELSGKIQQCQQESVRLDLIAKELKTENISLAAALKEKEKALAEAQQTMSSMKKSVADSQSAKQRDLENLNQSIAQLSAEKVFLVEEIAAEKKRANDLAVTLQGKDDSMKRLISEEAKRNASDSAAEVRLKQGEAEIARIQGERDGLQSKIKSLEARLKAESDLAAQAGDINNLRKEVTSSIAEIENLKKDNSALLDARKNSEARLTADLEKARAIALNTNKEAEKEKQAMLAASGELEKKLHDAAARVSQLLDEQKKMNAALKERDQSLVKAQEAIALLEKSLKGAEQEKASQLQELEERNKIEDTEKKALQDQLANEKKRVAGLSGKVSEREAALIDEMKVLQHSHQALEARLEAEKSESKSENRKLELERNSLHRQLQDLESQAAIAKDALSQVEESRKKQEELSKVAALNDKEIAKLKAEKTDLEARLRDIGKRQGDADLIMKKISEEKQVTESQLKDQQAKLAKSQEAIALLEKSLKGSEQEKARQLQDLESRAAIAKDALSQVEESRKKQEELSKVAALNDKEIAKLKAEKTDLEARLRDIEERFKALSGIKQHNERITAEKRDLEQRLTEERARFDADAQKIRAERDELKNQLGVLEALRNEKEELAARLDETKRLYADAQGKGGQAEKILQDNRILNDEKKQLENRLRSSDEKIAALIAQRDKGASLENEQKDLATRYDEQERKVKEQQSLISKLMVEKGGMEKDLKDGKQEIAAAKALKESRDLLQTELDRTRTQQKQMQAELTELKKIQEQNTAKNSELSGELSALKMQTRDYDKPFLRIGKEQYTLASVIREGIIASSVTDKMRAKNIPWRTGNIVDDFIVEQILAHRAREEAFSVDAKMKESLVRQYGLSDAEGAYLDRYLAIDWLYKSRVGMPAATEVEAREYYDKHREQYLHAHENRIRVLSIKYGKTDEAEKSIIAVEMHGEALEGKPFDSIARKRPALASMREMSLSRLPEWVRLRLASLREGEISNIISTDNELLIIQTIPSKTGYRPFEEVKKEIEKKLSADRSSRKQHFEDWLAAQKKEIGFLR